MNSVLMIWRDNEEMYCSHKITCILLLSSDKDVSVNTWGEKKCTPFYFNFYEASRKMSHRIISGLSQPKDLPDHQVQPATWHYKVHT